MRIALMYHDVFRHDINESGFTRERDRVYKLKVQQFEEQVATVSAYLKSINSSDIDIVFTFDDGGKSFYTNIAPVLEKYGFKGLFFISTQYIGNETFLTIPEIQDLLRRGHIIGSHAHTHEHLYTLSDEEVFNEWKTSTQILSDIIGIPIEYASIPNGDISTRVLQALVASGIKYIYSSKPTTKSFIWNNAEVIGRYVVLASMTLDEFKAIVSSPVKRFGLSCRYHVLNLLKRLLGSNYVTIKNRLMH